jgi:chromate transporter
VDCIAVAQSLPGAVIINTATYIGKKRGGTAGSLCALMGTILPSFIAMIALITVLSAVGENRYLAGFFRGALAAAAAMVTVAAFRLGKPILKKPGDWVLAIAAFVALIVFHVNIIFIIAASVAVGFALYFVRRRLASRKTSGNGADGNGASGTSRGSNGENPNDDSDTTKPTDENLNDDSDTTKPTGENPNDDSDTMNPTGENPNDDSDTTNLHGDNPNEDTIVDKIPDDDDSPGKDGED